MDLKNQSVFSLILQCPKGSPNDCKMKEEIELSIRSMGPVAQSPKKWRKISEQAFCPFGNCLSVNANNVTIVFHIRSSFKFHHKHKTHFPNCS